MEATLSDEYNTTLSAVKINGRALCAASLELRADETIVLAAVIQDGFALRYASSGLRANATTVHTAVN